MRLLEIVPTYRARQRDLEASTRQRLNSSIESEPPIVRIGIVVHVVTPAGAPTVSDAQIDSQIAVLNQDFRAANPDRTKTPTPWQGLIGDARIEFALANIDPDGNPTNGITRTVASVNAFGDDDAMKFTATGGQDAWPADRYLNLWVCPLAGGLLGYAQFPGGPEDTDGVVITLTAFGTEGTASKPFHLGRTATHEIGHYLNLRHIWGDTENCSGSDFVADTPNAAGPNTGTPTFPSITCSNGPDGDMFMNYMDYVDDEAMFLFTREQIVRMRAALDGPRASLATAGVV
jgi:hypothetical protein